MWRIAVFLLWSCFLKYLSSPCTRFGASLPTSKHGSTQAREPQTGLGKCGGVGFFVGGVFFNPVITPSLTTTWSWRFTPFLTFSFDSRTSKKEEHLSPSLSTCVHSSDCRWESVRIPPLCTILPVLCGHTQAEDGVKKFSLKLFFRG